MEITYRMQDGFLLPNLMLSAEPEVHLGKYAELRRQYLMKHRRVLYTNLKTTCRLTRSIWRRSRDRAEDGSADRGTAGAGRGRDGDDEGERPAALGGLDEQLQAYSGGTGTERLDLQLNDDDGNAGSDMLPAFLDTHLIEAILLDDGGRKHTRQDIFDYFQSHHDLAQRTEFFKKQLQRYMGGSPRRYK